MQTQKPICELDDTWEDVMDEFKAALAKETSKWSCYTLEGINPEALLSAPEVMDAKTDTGLGCEKVESLRGLLDRGAIPSVAKLSPEALLAVMDWILLGETRYLDGYSLVSCYLSFPYLLAMPELKKQNGTLFAYSQGVLRSLDYFLNAVFSTNVRTDEEFSMPPPELDRQAEVPLEQILAALETAAATAASPAIAARLRFRKALLSALSLFIDAKRRSDVEAACDLCAEALELITGADFDRADEPALPEGLERPEVRHWVSLLSPPSAVALPTFAEAREQWACMLRQLVSIKEGLLRPNASLGAITEYVEGLSAQKPLLPVRCITTVVVLSCEPRSSFIYGLPVHQRILEHLAVGCGAPLYLRLCDGDEALLDSIIKYRVHRTTDPTRVTPAQMQQLRDEASELLRRWVSEACRLYLTHLESMLCNRGLAHRRLMNAVESLAAFWELSVHLDMNVFMALEPGTTERQAECSNAAQVLSLYANALVLRNMELIVSFQVELDLLMQAEVLPALWYLNYTHRAQLQNYAMLYLSNVDFAPRELVNKKTRVPVHNLAVTSRRPALPDPVAATLTEAQRALSEAIFTSACVLEHKGLIDLHSAPPHSLITAEDAFNHRFAKCFGPLQSPPLSSYHACMSSIPDFGAEPARLPAYAKRAGEVAAMAAEKAKVLVSSSSSTVIDESRRKFITPYVVGLERTARAVSASLAFLVSLLGEPSADAEGEGKQAAPAAAVDLSAYQGVIDRPGLPHLLCFTVHKKVDRK